MSIVVESATGRDRVARLVALAREIGDVGQAHAVAHDRDGSFVTEAFDAVRSSGYLAAAVPEELGGMGATVADLCQAQAELARRCASTALALSMHMHLVLTAAWRWRRGEPTETVLRRVVDESIVLVSSGASDWTRPEAVATPVDGGGYRVTGRKVFASQSPVGDVLSTSAHVRNEHGPDHILAIGIPLAAEGVRLVETWDTLGMRGTASHDIVLDDVRIADAQVSATRPWGVIDRLLTAAVIHAIPVISSVYWGVARAARDLVVERLAGTAKAADTIAQRQVGLMDHLLSTSWWALEGAVRDNGDDPEATAEAFSRVMLAKRSIAVQALEVVDTAMELAGGASYFKTLPLEQAFRDVRGAKYHPFTPELTLVHAGRLALGEPADDM